MGTFPYLGTTKRMQCVLVSTERGTSLQKMAVCWHTRPRFGTTEAMTANTSAADKSIVTELDFTSRTGKRVAWETWEFTIEGPYLVRVTNAAYGYLKDDHQYTVGVAERDGQIIPAECECPADLHHDSDCKHKIALAACGGVTVMQAAVDYEPSGDTKARQNVSTAADKLRTDGGTATASEGGNHTLDASKHAECDCAELAGDFPCWPCVRDGKRELPE